MRLFSALRRCCVQAEPDGGTVDSRDAPHGASDEPRSRRHWYSLLLNLTFVRPNLQYRKNANYDLHVNSQSERLLAYSQQRRKQLQNLNMMSNVQKADFCGI